MFKKASICALSILLVLSVYSAYQPANRQSIASANSGNADQRYFMYGAGDTQDMNLYEDLVDQAIAYGMNSFRVWFSWSSFQNEDGTFDWSLMDAQLDYIDNKNMPFALSLYFAMGPDGGLPEAERVKDASGALTPYLSINSATAMDKVVEAYEAVISRYTARYPTNKPIFVSALFGMYGENEISGGGNGLMGDYSEASKQAFRSWLLDRYEDISSLNTHWGTQYASFAQVEPPTDFNGNKGLTWYQFRHHVLKSAVDRLADANHAIGGTKFPLVMGSMFDDSASKRGTLDFVDLAEKADIVFVDDGPEYNHAFSMDLLRTNLPGKELAHEFDGPDLADNATYYHQASTAFEHGAKYVTNGNWNKSLQKFIDRGQLFEDIVDDYLGDPVTEINNPSQSMFVSDYDMLLNRSSAAYQRYYDALYVNNLEPMNVHLLRDINRLDWHKTNNDEPNLILQGNWAEQREDGPFQGDDLATDQVGASVEFSFNGDRIEWIGSKGTDHGKADVYIDGLLEASGVDLYAGQKQYQQVLYAKDNLTDGEHTIKIVATGQKNALSSDAFVNLDALSYHFTEFPAPPKIYRLSSQYSATQGENGWYYKYHDGNGYVNMTWNAGRWQGPNPYLFIESTTHMMPDGYDVVPVWKAPKSGTIRIKGNVKKDDMAGAICPGCADGIQVKIMKNGTQIWPTTGWQQLADDDLIGVWHDLTINVAQNDLIYFVMNQKTNNYWDGSSWDPSISYVAPVYQLSAQYSNIQGQDGWRYQYDGGSGPVDMTWVNNRWQGPGSVDYSFVEPTAHLMAETYDLLTNWEAPFDGTVRIYGTAKMDDDGGSSCYGCGDGIRVKIMKNGTQVWPSSGWQSIQAVDLIGVAHDIDVQVQQGDRIYFVVNQNANIYYDGASWNPSIRYRIS
ncbi:beta-galactosidase [Cohnella phaseoli]|uniref:Beta-galactosidase-like protein n=1 Tax=Cohnella phaseoli TaxID=456490 RepID=A0A3D9I9W7_9BACL|nr:beta-galactosidase [Cohnella phaseoli]RED57966.1 beta-galactosidase-like protein [Cohnella phaseoli]